MHILETVMFWKPKPDLQAAILLRSNNRLEDIQLRVRKNFGIDYATFRGWRLDEDNQIYDPELGTYIQIICETSADPIPVFGEVKEKVTKSMLDGLGEEITDEEMAIEAARQKRRDATGWVGTALLLVVAATILIIVINLISTGSFSIPMFNK